MPNQMSSFGQLDLSELVDSVCSYEASENFHEGKLDEQPQTQHSSAEEGRSTSHGYHHEQQHQQDSPLQPSSDLINKLFDASTQPDLSASKDELRKERPYAASLEILTRYGCSFPRLTGEKAKTPRFLVKSTGIVKKKLSTNEILKLAAEKFIQSSDPKNKYELSKISRQDASSEENNGDVELVLHLLSAAQKVGERDYRKVKKILKKCNELSFDKGNPVQRLGHYFSAALRERVDRESGRWVSKGFGRQLLDYIEESLSTISSTALALQKVLPFCCVSQFAGMQVIIEKVEGARKVHIIDLQIGTGLQHTVLIQAIGSRSENSVLILKITAVATKCKQAVEATGRRLRSFAQSFNLPFDFNVVLVEDILYLHESLFEVEDDEAVAVYSAYFLMSKIEKTDELQYLMTVIRNIDPCIMVVTEVEANHNSPVFVDRFTEALFYYGAFFDIFEDCLKDDEENRMVMESMFFGPGIKNVVAAEEEERTIRMVKISVWRAFFARFRMFEVELSTSSIFQANLLLKEFPCGGSCTLEMDGKSLLVGWKGTPAYSLSAWIFN